VGRGGALGTQEVEIALDHIRHGPRLTHEIRTRPMSKPLVIVESPTKKNTIQKFLGSSYVVEASVGHVRDLPESGADIPAPVRERLKGKPWRDFGVDVEADFAPIYVVPDDKKKQVARLKELLKDASALYLATDEDREGESISWHLLEVLKPRVPVKRLVFHEITEEAIRASLAHARDVDQHLVRAQETRRIVDRLYGWDVSPLLWKKVRPKLSAGRVQSVAVRLVVDRERARLAFRAGTWWDLEASFATPKGSLAATLVEVGGKRIATGKDFDETTGALKAKDVRLLVEAEARALAERLRGQPGRIGKVDARPYRDRPAPPFTTSTLQQESNRKLRWTAKRTMQIAQRLYERGWITYMRTDATALSDQAIAAARGLIHGAYGAEYLPPSPRLYKSQAKNAQEAHEAIRPAGARFRGLDEARRELDADDARLYELIWKRTVACQMADATGQLVSVSVDVADARFAASGKTIEFPGFRRAYVEGSDDPDAELADQEKLLPAVAPGDPARAESLQPKGHTTQPPARLTEATLVKELERLGVGRPSTYADIIEKILAREYVFKKSTALVPTFTAFAVTGLLEKHLTELVDYDFTAKMEDDLDSIAMGRKDWVGTLRAFYLGASGLRTRLGQAEASADPREVCTIPIGADVTVRVGRYGPFLAQGERTADLPEDVAPDEVNVEWAVARLDGKANGPRELGKDRAGTPVFLFNGRFGPYVQLGEAGEGEKPPRASLLPGMSPDGLELDTALRLLSLPRTLGKKDGEEVIASNGRFGPYVRCGKETRSVPAGMSVLDLSLEQALQVLAAPARRGRAGIEPLREIGVDPVSKAPIKLMKGRFGPYVTDGTTNASLPKGANPDQLGVDEAAGLLAARREAGPPVKRAGRGRRGPPRPVGVKKVVGAKSKAPAKRAAAEAAPATKKAATGAKTAKKPSTATKKPTATKKAATAKAGKAEPAAATPTVRRKKPGSA